MQLMTAEEAAEYLGVSVRTLRAWRSQGRGPSWVALESSIRYRRESVEGYITEREHVPGERVEEEEKDE